MPREPRVYTPKPLIRHVPAPKPNLKNHNRPLETFKAPSPDTHQGTHLRAGPTTCPAHTAAGASPLTDQAPGRRRWHYARARSAHTHTSLAQAGDTSQVKVWCVQTRHRPTCLAVLEIASSISARLPQLSAVLQLHLDTRIGHSRNRTAGVQTCSHGSPHVSLLLASTMPLT